MRQHKMFTNGLVAMLFALLLPAALYAQELPAQQNPPRLVNDFAHVMSADEVSLLERKLLDFSKETSNQVAIVTIPTTNGYEIAAYATKLFNTWQIGTAKNNNGVLILAAMQDHKIFIPVGRGLQAALPDITTKQIIDEQITPAFRQNNYAQGFNRGVDAVIAATKGEYQGAGAQQQQSVRGISGGTIITLIVILIVIISFIKRGGGGGGSFMSRRGSGGFGGGFLTGSILGSMLGGGGGSSGGWGGGGDSGGGGGFGGFGGGSTDGGGAGGSW